MIIQHSVSYLLPAATTGFVPPRSEAEAKAVAAKLNEAARRLRELNERDAQRRRQEAEALAARTRHLSGHRPTSTRTTAAKTPNLSTSAVYSTYNRARAVLPETRSELCPAACFAPEMCDGEKCWSKSLEVKPATGSKAVSRLDTRAIYAEHNRQHAAARSIVGPR